MRAAQTCPNCGNHYDPNDKQAAKRSPIFPCRREIERHTGTTHDTFECWGCFHYFIVSDNPGWQYERRIVGDRAYPLRKS